MTVAGANDGFAGRCWLGVRLPPLCLWVTTSHDLSYRILFAAIRAHTIEGSVSVSLNGMPALRELLSVSTSYPAHDAIKSQLTVTCVRFLLGVLKQCLRNIAGLASIGVGAIYRNIRSNV